jgi:hypothetical protein
MAYRVMLDSPFVRVRFSGEVTGADLRAVAAELEAHEQQLVRIPDRLVDLSGMVKAALTFHVALEAARFRRVQTFPNAFRSALFAPTETSAGFAKIFQTLNVNAQIEVRIFSDLSEAERWLADTLLPMGD